MDNRKANLFADFGVVGAHRLDVLLMEHNVNRARSAYRTRPSWSWARHGRAREAISFSGPAAVIGDPAASPPPEQRRYECDCEIPAGRESSTSSATLVKRSRIIDADTTLGICVRLPEQGAVECLLTVELEGAGNGNRKSDPDFAVRHASIRSLCAVFGILFGCKLAALHVACI